ncbi:HotDog domain-containing protein [Xylaria telfairii]|nr:HotDog domain-containing protein [Xylaria telfairii]
MYQEIFIFLTYGGGSSSRSRKPGYSSAEHLLDHNPALFWLQLNTMLLTLESSYPDLQHFLGIPWCAKHLRMAGVQISTGPGRHPNVSGEDEVWFRTLNTSNTIPYFIAFYPTPQGDKPPISEVYAFATLQSGVQGFPGQVQGGIIATLLDGIAGLIPGFNRQRGVWAAVPFVTAHMNIIYVQPVAAPGTVILSARITKVEGRKVFVEASVRDDGGNVLARADILFIETTARL